MMLVHVYLKAIIQQTAVNISEPDTSLCVV